jgi:hypothetical protein
VWFLLAWTLAAASSTASPYDLSCGRVTSGLRGPVAQCRHLFSPEVTEPDPRVWDRYELHRATAIGGAGGVAAGLTLSGVVGAIYTLQDRGGDSPALPLVIGCGALTAAIGGALLVGSTAIASWELRLGGVRVPLVGLFGVAAMGSVTIMREADVYVDGLEHDLLSITYFGGFGAAMAQIPLTFTSRRRHERRVASAGL